MALPKGKKQKFDDEEESDFQFNAKAAFEKFQEKKKSKAGGFHDRLALMAEQSRIKRRNIPQFRNKRAKTVKVNPELDSDTENLYNQDSKDDQDDFDEDSEEEEIK